MKSKTPGRERWICIRGGDNPHGLSAELGGLAQEVHRLGSDLEVGRTQEE